MSELNFETWTIPAADMGTDSPLPSLHAGKDLHAKVKPDTTIPAEDQAYIGYGNVRGCFPYAIQNGYDRVLQPREFSVAILENEILRAAFLIERGGRLWSLLHKPSGRELLHVPPIFQPANLAIRNAWFCGGIEWNVGLAGHTPFTCAPLFVARARAPDGAPALRMYEWERIRQAPFQLDAYLPDNSPVLFVRVTLRNPHDHEIPMYWWSNIAVPETSETRVLAPADRAYRFGYAGGLQQVAIPLCDGQDVTYPTRKKQAMDFFYRIPDGERPWIAALDGNGCGLAQTSTSRLKGRKLFLWGTGAGGKRWQEHLSGPGKAYIEIQAGLARTQSEHLPMPPRAEWTWLEAYGMIEAEPAKAHGADWQTATGAVSRQIDRLIGGYSLDAGLERGRHMAASPPEEIVQRGSGWGALEQRRRVCMRQPPLCPPSLVFDENSLGTSQMPWLELLSNGVFPPADPALPPQEGVMGPEWLKLLDQAVRLGQPSSGHWLAWLHLGNMRYNAGDVQGALDAWQASLNDCQSAWALRNLAVLARQQNRYDEAVERYLQAVRMQPGCMALVVECGQLLIDAGKPAAWTDLLPDLPKSIRMNGRVRLLEGRAALETGDLQTVTRILDEGTEISDMREGEQSLSDLWFGLHERRLSKNERIPLDDSLRARVRREYPPPARMDYRMQSFEEGSG